MTGIALTDKVKFLLSGGVLETDLVTTLNAIEKKYGSVNKNTLEAHLRFQRTRQPLSSPIKPLSISFGK